MIRAPSTVARALERGQLATGATRWLGRVWARHARVVRPVDAPGLATVIGVGGATLGGSYKTPLVLALARALRAADAPVAVVAHGYGTSAPTARRVSVEDTARTVGDDAVWLGRDLAAAGVPVFVGPRARSLELAVAGGRTVVVDGLLQSRPRRLGLSLLVVDGLSPWGAGACPPAGDLRAPEAALLSAADAVVAVVPAAPAAGTPTPLTGLMSAVAAAGRVLFMVSSALEATGASSGASVSLASLASRRVGVVTAIARPDRVTRSLGDHGIVPAVVRHFADHGWPRARESRRAAPRIDVWLTTAKCATKIGARYEGAPVVVVGPRLSLPEPLLARCCRLRAHELADRQGD